MFASTGLTGPPCGVPSVARLTTPFSMTPAFSHLPSSRSPPQAGSPDAARTSATRLRRVHVVEVPLDVHLHDPPHPWPHQPLAQPMQRRVGAPFRSISVRALQKVLLVHRPQHPGHRLLDHPILDGRDPQRPPPTIPLRNVRPPDRRCPIAPAP